MSPQPVMLSTIDGLHLDGEWSVSPANRVIAVLAHPHPAGGGSMNAPVIDRLFHALDAHGIGVCRFDFRGVGHSEGEHDDGVAERLDVAAAIDAVSLVAPDAAIVLVGYSFGANVALNVVDPRVAAWCAISPQARAGFLAGNDHRRVRLLVGTHDQFCPPPQVKVATESWSATEIIEVPRADHFFAGSLSIVVEAVVGFIDGLNGELG